MPSVKSRPNENIEILIRKFKNKCEQAGILNDIRKKEFYEKPTEVRKKAKKQAVNRTVISQNKNKIDKKRKY